MPAPARISSGTHAMILDYLLGGAAAALLLAYMIAVVLWPEKF